MAIDRLLRWLDESSCNFMAVATMRRELDKAGFIALDPSADWHLQPGGRYYTVRNDSAIMAWICGTSPLAETGARIIAAHSDSPCFKIKPNAEIIGDGGVVCLNVEKYGGGIMYTWFDRPLSISGRVMTAGTDPLHPRTHLVDLRRAVAVIPHLAIHFNRSVNEGNPLSVQKDMKPVLGYYDMSELRQLMARGGVVRCMVADHIGVQPEEILDYELCLYPCEPAGLCGASEEYFQSARIDDLSMAFGALEALLDTADLPCSATRIMAIFDNEETGSGTRQGAASPLLRDILERITTIETPNDGQGVYKAIASSFLISADDAHAWHPNYNEKYDPTNHPVIGGGPVVKINANCKYMTDAHSAAVFRSLCAKAGVNCQVFVNHGDVAGGSTLGNILTSQLDVAGVDMGNAIWAMHSARETAGVSDQTDAVRVFKAFYGEC